MAINPEALKYIEQTSAARPPLNQMSLEEARRLVIAARVTNDAEPLAQVEELSIPGPDGQLRVRIYTPLGAGPFPLLVYFHGGGWVVGAVETVDGSCRKLTNNGGCVTVSVDYRLAPEHKFPAATKDCFAALKWVALNARSIGSDAGRIAVGGESAGANLAAVAALMARDNGGPKLAGQLLVYPVLDHRFDTESYLEHAHGYVITKELMIWFWRHYLRDESDAGNPYASPLQARDLSGLPPTALFTAEYDPLRDEGAAYARRLQQTAVPVFYKCWEGLPHGFFGMADVVKEARAAVDDAARWIREIPAR
jgi:acetyl esterase